MGIKPVIQGSPEGRPRSFFSFGIQEPPGSTRVTAMMTFEVLDVAIELSSSFWLNPNVMQTDMGHSKVQWGSTICHRGPPGLGNHYHCWVVELWSEATCHSPPAPPPPPNLAPPPRLCHRAIQ